MYNTHVSWLAGWRTLGWYYIIIIILFSDDPHGMAWDHYAHSLFLLLYFILSIIPSTTHHELVAFCISKPRSRP
jgi:hypothetical protein